MNTSRTSPLQGHLAVLKVTVCHTAGHLGEEYAMTETCSAVLRSRRNCSSDGAERTDDGRAFHARAAVTGKARSPSVITHTMRAASKTVQSALRLFVGLVAEITKLQGPLWQFVTDPYT